ncbi:MAG TPA: cysteine peptidase family C39 domain-containing protein [Mucilaginibacter sp.]|nr:cysteine peptidase family C39 domain-containing protein [Mucilaginibacter sp.]
MISFLNLNNPDAAVTNFLRSLGTSIEPKTIVGEFEKHPDYPSLLSISDVLTNFDIENTAFRIDFEELDTLPCPFIAHTTMNGGDFMVVYGFERDKIVVSDQKRSRYKMSFEEFKRIYAGVALVAEGKGSEPLRFVDRRIFTGLGILAVLAIVLIFNTSYFASLSWQSVALAFVKTAGLATSVLLLIQSIDDNNPLVQRLCQAGGKKSDCSAILSSKAARVFSWLSWSEVGFFYFAGTWLMTLFGGHSPLNWLLLLFFNVISLPYTFYSIYYQARVAKQWCVFCCTIQALLWLEFIPLLSSNLPINLNIPVNAGSIADILACLVSPILLWSVLKPLLLKVQQVGPLKQQLRKFKYNSDLFNKMLNDQPKYVQPDDSWSLVLGNAEASNCITMVTNPYCPPCAKTHKLLDQLLAENNNVQARIVFTANNTDKDIKTPVSRHMMALNDLPDKNIMKKALHDWYEEKQKNYEAWARLYPVELDPANFYKLDKQHDWCQMAEVKSTPTLLLNGHILPQAYQLPDLKYMLQ